MARVRFVTGDPVVRLRSVSVVRGHRTVLHDLDLDLPAQRIVGIVGPSGSGKSTLMRSIVGVQQHVTGSLEVLGQPAGAPPLRGDIGFMAQDVAAYDDLSVRENLRYVARLLGAGNDRVDEVIAAVRLEDVQRQRVDDLSGGQRTRVSLAIALLNGPRLLVLDEPTVGLDPVLRRELWDRFRELADGGRSLLVTSHVMDEADRCDWLVLLREGRVLASGTVPDLLGRTGTTTVEGAFLALVGGEAPA